MIFVSVGTQKFQFDRLIKTIDELVGNNIIREQVFAQIGYCKYLPHNIEYKDFLKKNDFENKVHASRLLITHSGVGTIISGIKAEKPIIVVPRLKKYNEHVDDHQVQISKAFAELNLVIECLDEKKLGFLIKQAYCHNFDKYNSNRDLVINIIKNFLDGI